MTEVKQRRRTHEENGGHQRHHNNKYTQQSKYQDKRKKPRSVGRWYIGDTLGKGGYSWVKKGYDKQRASKCVALKFMTKADQTWVEEQTKQVIAEIESLKTVRHENVMKLYAYSLNAKYPTRNKEKIDCILLVLEYCPGGELFDILYYTSALEPTIARTYFRQFIFGLEACHNANVVHRDIKPQNLLLDRKFNLKICDFGLSKIFKKDVKKQDMIMKTTYVGTRGYQAPELLLNHNYTSSADIFSAGVVLFILLTGYPPFEESKKSDRWFKPLIRQNYKRFWQQHHGCQISSDYKGQDLIQKMLAFNPIKRITIEEIKKHEWFNGKYLEGKNLIRILRKRHRAMESKRRKDVKKLKDLQHSITKRNIPGLEQHTVLPFPSNGIEGIYDIHSVASWKDIYNVIHDVVGDLNGDSDFNFETMTLTCSINLQNPNRRTETIVSFETQVFESREFVNKQLSNEEESEPIYVVRFRRTSGSTLDWKKILRDTIYTKCAGVLTGLPKWARQQMKNRDNECDSDSEDDYDKFLDTASLDYTDDEQEEEQQLE